MIFLQFFSPLLYSFVIGTAWVVITKKRFFESLAPAYMSQILLALLSGIICKRITIGFMVGFFVSLAIVISHVFKNSKNVFKLARSIWDEGLCIFTVLYFFVFFSNIDKRFLAWDEFQHWGMFLKESYRLDMLYCMSNLSFWHKDYVPAITIFETIWCRVSYGYSEPNAYRAVQIFMISMLLPLIGDIFLIVDNKTELLKKHRKFFKVSVVLILLLVPLYFDSKNGFLFYHSIYCDLISGIVLFYCLYESYRQEKISICHCISLILGISIFVLTKMTSIAIIPIILLFEFICIYLFQKEKKIVGVLSLAIVSGIPFLIWYVFNKFVDIYVRNTGGYQSYDGIKLSSIARVFFSEYSNKSFYLNEVREKYINAIIYKDVLVKGSYFVVILFSLVLMMLICTLIIDYNKRKKVIIFSFWMLFSSFYYAILMYYLYCTSFSEVEAVQLASYERYMNSFLIAIVFMVLAIYLNSSLWLKYAREYKWILFLFIFWILFFHVDLLEQIVPGSISLDEDKIEQYVECANFIKQNTEENSRVYIIARGDSGALITRESYYCNPTEIKGGSIGPMAFDGDVFSYDIDEEKFVMDLEECDFVFFYETDRAFFEKYSGAFINPSDIVEGSIYRVEKELNKIRLTKINGIDNYELYKKIKEYDNIQNSPIEVLNNKEIYFIEEASIITVDYNNIGIECHGALERDYTKEDYYTFLKEKGFKGIEFKVKPSEGYGFLSFQAKKASKNGSFTVLICDESGNVVSDYEKTYSDMDDQYHHYIVDLPQEKGELTIIINGAYKDMTGDPESIMRIKNIYVY